MNYFFSSPDGSSSVEHYSHNIQPFPFATLSLDIVAAQLHGKASLEMVYELADLLGLMQLGANEYNKAVQLQSPSNPSTSFWSTLSASTSKHKLINHAFLAWPLSHQNTRLMH